MLKNLKLYKKTNLYFVFLFITNCVGNYANKDIVFIKKESIFYNDYLYDITSKINLVKCLECSEKGNVFFYSEETILIDSLSGGGINAMSYLTFNQDQKLVGIKKVYIFDYYISKKNLKSVEMKKIQTEFILLHEFLLNKSNGLNKKVHGLIHSIELDTTNIYPTLSYEIKE